jgi:hypothetical protein
VTDPAMSIDLSLEGSRATGTIVGDFALPGTGLLFKIGSLDGARPLADGAVDSAGAIQGPLHARISVFTSLWFDCDSTAHRFFLQPLGPAR